MTPNSSSTADTDLIEAVLTKLASHWFPDSVCLYAHATHEQPNPFNEARFSDLGIQLDATAKMPDVVLHDAKRNWLILIEAVTSAGPVDGKRRSELKKLFKGCTAGLVFVTAFETRKAMQAFLGQISWESEVWIAEAPDHLIHFNGERFLGPYPDSMPKN